ncbi:MAG: CatB-related O-acetyltransferase [Lachnospiraceae bacterium]|nr:CatB-related O-acetyltransferase [Lachnospiraceae bacterium]
MTIIRNLRSIIERAYRIILYPVKSFAVECSTGSIFLPGSYFSKDSVIEGKNYLGKNTAIHGCRLGYGSYINNNGDFSHTDIGYYTSIGANVTTAVGSHPLNGYVALHPAFTYKKKVFGYSFVDKDIYTDETPRISIGSDVWIGNNVVILDGAKIGDGAVVGAGSVVKGELPPYSINAGVPAKTIRYRFTEEEIQALLKLKWWEKDESWIRSHIEDFNDVSRLTGK